ncbi:MAG: acylphosphatase, partial [Dehalococcoidia bacterium]
MAATEGPKPGVVALRAVVRGRVQGVGFRDFVWRRAAFLGLVGTGIPLLPFKRLPFGLDFRGWIGGYSSLIMSWHTWLAIAFIFLPSIVFLVGWLGRRGELQDERQRGIGRSEPFRPASWANVFNRVKRVHVWVTIVMAS